MTSAACSGALGSLGPAGAIGAAASVVAAGLSCCTSCGAVSCCTSCGAVRDIRKNCISGVRWGYSSFIFAGLDIKIFLCLPWLATLCRGGIFPSHSGSGGFSRPLALFNSSEFLWEEWAQVPLIVMSLNDSHIPSIYELPKSLFLSPWL